MRSRIHHFCTPWPRQGLIRAVARPQPMAPPWDWPCWKRWSGWSNNDGRLRGDRGFPWDDLLRRVRQVAGALLRLQEEDVQAYFNLAQARRGGDPRKLAAALEEALGCPLRTMQQAQEGLVLISQGGARCKIHLLSDLLVACELLGAAFRGAHHIAWANLLLMHQSSRRVVWAEDLAHTLKAAEAVLQQVSAELLDRQSCH